MAKSWDIQPQKKPARPAAAEPRAEQPRRFEDIRPAAPKRPAPRQAAASVPTRREAVRRSAPPSTRTPLRARRKRARTRIFTIVLSAMLALFILVLIALWQPWLRIAAVNATGPDADRLQAFVQKELTGTRYGIFPRSSIFFIPDQEIRAHILAAFPDLDAVSIRPSGLNSLTVTTTSRAAVAWWCGSSLGTPADSCYQMDAQGLVFSPVPLDQRFATDSALSIYGPLASTTATGGVLQSASALPGIIQFVKAMKDLNADVVSVDIRGDEADLYTQAGTRITYVIGREQQAANLAASAFPTLNLNDGSLLYVDLRFDSKVFFKKK